MEKKYVVVSLFNGMGCVWIALDKAGIQVSQRISSEVDEHAIHANDAMYPDTIQVGDVRKINVIKDKKGRPIKLETENGIVDLLDNEIILAGGSPCQSFSFAGKMKGMSTKDEQEVLTLDHYMKLKEQEYEFEGQSYLFWEYMRIKTELNPKYFLLENVIMVHKWRNILSRAIGINPIRIDSSLLSAQNRDRYYWCNFNAQPQGLFGDIECMIPQPKDMGIFLKDVLEKDVDEKYYLKDNQLKWWNENAEFQLEKKYSSLDAEKGITQTARQYASWNGNFVSEDDAVGLREVRSEEGKKIRKENSKKGVDYNPHRAKAVEERTDGKTGALLTSPTKDNLIKVRQNLFDDNSIYTEKDKNKKHQQDAINDVDGKANCLVVGSHLNSAHFTKTEIKGGDFRTDEGFRWRDNGKTGTLAARARQDESCGQLANINSRIRKLTPIECERLQTCPDNATKFGLKRYIQRFDTKSKNTSWQQYAESKNVISQSKAAKLTSATNTVSDFLDSELPNYQDSLSISLKNAKWKIATGTSKQTSTSVCCTISGLQDTEFLSYLKGLTEKRLNVSFAATKSEDLERLECVLHITKCGDFTETLSLTKKKGSNQQTTDTLEGLVDRHFIEMLSRKKSEGNSQSRKLSTILTLINLIITRTIWRFSPNPHTRLCICSSVGLRKNSLELNLSYIETENTTLISDSARYKLLGNGWTCDVIAYIFSHIQ